MEGGQKKLPGRLASMWLLHTTKTYITPIFKNKKRKQFMQSEINGELNFMWNCMISYNYVKYLPKTACQSKLNGAHNTNNNICTYVATKDKFYLE